MKFLLPTRSRLTSVGISVLLSLPACTSAQTVAAHQVQQQPAPIVRSHSATGSKSGLGRPSGEHLAEWMGRHSNLTPDQQQKALESEPGFSELPPQTQQRMREHLAELNAMTPAQRQRMLERNEAMEHLSPPQREQVRAAMKQLAELPPDDRRYVARTFRGLRELAPAQRQTVLASERFNHLTDAQRASLNSLMAVEPLLPPPYDAGAAPAHEVSAR